MDFTMMQRNRLISSEIFSASEWTPTRAKSRLCIGRDARRWRGQPGHSDTSGWFTVYSLRHRQMRTLGCRIAAW